jgi:hypothetical protein
MSTGTTLAGRFGVSPMIAAWSELFVNELLHWNRKRERMGRGGEAEVSGIEQESRGTKYTLGEGARSTT